MTIMGYILLDKRNIKSGKKQNGTWVLIHRGFVEDILLEIDYYYGPNGELVKVHIFDKPISLKEWKHLDYLLDNMSFNTRKGFGAKLYKPQSPYYPLGQDIWKSHLTKSLDHSNLI